MLTRQEFITSLFRYLIAAILVVVSVLLTGRKRVSPAQGQPCARQNRCNGCSQDGHCPYQPASGISR
ncbi:MAG TPA: hypothetical protein PLP19_07290 [bacterium]|nr:hypothetical protein [bacterium]HPN43275.1 hypothetical protein [bacterium]